jgi:HTH-type transcriptional regulator/antitoxin HipB
MDYPIQTPAQLSSHLRALRKARGLSQSQLGAVLGVGQTRVARIERDPAAIRVDQFLAVLNALGVQMVLRPTAVLHAGAAPGKGRSSPTDEAW